MDCSKVRDTSYNNNCTDNSSVPLSANDTSRDEAIVVSNIVLRLRFKEGTFPKVRERIRSTKYGAEQKFGP